MTDESAHAVKDFVETVRGPEFLVLFFGWFLLCWTTLLALRKTGRDHPLTTIVMLMLFEGVGVARYVIGSAAGMECWNGLFLMMAIGALFFIVREHATGTHQDGGGTSSSSCSTGGGGCGSAGCGGGGCGGCGS